MSHSNAQSPPVSGPNQPQTGPVVSISVNGASVEVHRGRRTVAEIKNAGGVPQADILEQIIDGQLTPLPDDGSVVIRGGEQFVSHIRGACSS